MPVDEFGSPSPNGVPGPQFNFDDLAPQSITFGYRGEVYTLHEPSAAVRVALRAKHTRGMQMTIDESGGRKTTFQADQASDSDVYLVGECLRDSQNRKVPPATIAAYGARMIERLAGECRRMGDLDDESQEALERQFGLLCKRLYKLGKTTEERQQWSAWMHGQVAEHAEVGVGTAEERAKNLQTAGAASSASAQS